MHRALAFFFGIHIIDAPRMAFVALALVNACLMLWLAWRRRWSYFSAYLVIAALASLLRKSPVWNERRELIVACCALSWIGTTVWRSAGRWWALGLSVAFFGVLLLIDPQPWPRSDIASWAILLYSSMACAAMLAGLMTWEWKRPQWYHILTLAWFTAILASDAPPGQYFTRGIAVKLVWTGCLAGWIWKGKQNESQCLRFQIQMQNGLESRKRRMCVAHSSTVPEMTIPPP